MRLKDRVGKTLRCGAATHGGDVALLRHQPGESPAGSLAAIAATLPPGGGMNLHERGFAATSDGPTGAAATQWD